MRWIVATTLAFALTAATARAACPATPVHGSVVRAGAFTGYVTPAYDVVQGRFRLHVGEYRDRATGLSQKIPWFVPLRYRVSDWLVVRGRRLDAPARPFLDRFTIAYSADTPDRNVF